MEWEHNKENIASDRGAKSDDIPQAVVLNSDRTMTTVGNTTVSTHAVVLDETKTVRTLSPGTAQPTTLEGTYSMGIQLAVSTSV
jgi:hypothetical protein